MTRRIKDTIEANISGNASTATELATARTIRTNLGSTSTASFDGSANITPGVTGTLPITNGGTGATTAPAALTNLGITATAAELNKMDGVTATTTELNYTDGVTSNIQTQLNAKLPLAGGIMTGAITHNAKNNTFASVGGSWINGKTQTNSPIAFTAQVTKDGSRYDPYIWGRNTDGDVWNFGGGASNEVGFWGFKSARTADGTDWGFRINITSGAVTSTSTIAAPTFSGALSGNASTATKLATARTIRTNLGSTSTASFDGSANITPGVTGTLPIANGGTGNTTGLAASATKLATARTIRTNLGSTSTASFDGSANITPGVTGTLAIGNGGTGGTTAATARANLGTLSAVSADGYYGMGLPDGTTSNWIRTTSSGIIPYHAGGASALGTSGWPFNTSYISNMYGSLTGGIKGITSGGTGAAYTATVNGITSLTAGVSFIMVPNVVSTSTAPTLNVNSLGAKTIRMRLSSGSSSTTALTKAALLAAGKPVKMVYDGTYWIVDDMVRPDVANLYGSLAASNVKLSNGTTMQSAWDSISQWTTVRFTAPTSGIATYTIKMLINKSLKIGIVIGSMGNFNISTNQSSCGIGSATITSCPFKTTSIPTAIIAQDNTSAPTMRVSAILHITVSGTSVKLSCTPNLWSNIADATNVALHIPSAVFTW